jgi:two-component system nitrogen regulation sensor histidine kinase GlnL
LPSRPKPVPLPHAARTQAPWADVLASIGDAVVVLDADGRVLELNPAAEQLAGVSAPQTVGQPLATLLGARSGNGWIVDLVRATLTQGVARRRSEGTLARREGEVAVAVACTPIYDTGGGRGGAVLVLHDLSLQHTLEATTRRAERLAALGTVSAGLAHEIRNPLGGIKGAAQLLRNALTDPQLIHCTDIIINEVERLDGLVEQLRELSARPRLSLEAVNIHRVLNEVVALQRRAPAWGGVVLRVEFDPSLPAVLGDRAQLTQVFLNLVKNAVEAMDGTGTLQISTRIETRFHIRQASGRRHFLSVFVDDTGPGIPEAALPDLFAPFFTTKPRGTGLGLAICHRIVSEHGGTIAYEPRPAGGARFRVTLPVSEDDADPGR